MLFEVKKKKEPLTKSITKLRDEVATEFNISIDTVRSYVSLLSLSKELQSLIVLNHGNRKKTRIKIFFFISCISCISCSKKNGGSKKILKKRLKAATCGKKRLPAAKSC